MSAPPKASYQRIFDTVRQWPPERRFTLVQDILNTLALEMQPSHPRRKTLEKALGLLVTDRPAPSDADIQQWLEERRMERYR